MSRNKEEILGSYIQFIDFLADFLGEDYELVLHDVENLEKSIVYIRNNFSGRQIGGPMTDLGLRVLREKRYINEQYYVNYNSRTIDGRVIRSATYFISDDKGKLVAMLCINVDVTKAQFFMDYLDGFVKGANNNGFIQMGNQSENKDVAETLSGSVEDLAYQMMNEVLSRYSVPADRMNLDEKKEVISELDKKGFFLIKGTVKTVSNRLDLSETTVYRCINSY